MRTTSPMSQQREWTRNINSTVNTLRNASQRPQASSIIETSISLCTEMVSNDDIIMIIIIIIIIIGSLFDE